jgi:hypothetical protein
MKFFNWLFGKKETKIHNKICDNCNHSIIGLYVVLSDDDNNETDVIYCYDCTEALGIDIINHLEEEN